MTSVTSATYQLKVMFDDSWVEIYPENKLSNASVTIHYFENSLHIRMNPSENIGTLYSWWNNKVVGSASYHTYEFHRLDVQVNLDQYFDE